MEELLRPYKKILDQLKEARRRLKHLKKKFIKRLHEARAALSPDDCRELVLDIFHEKLPGHLNSYVTEHRQAVIGAVENWWDKYRVTLRDIEKEKAAAREKLSHFYEVLAYAI